MRVLIDSGDRFAMGHWGVKSFENDDAWDALDAGFARVHGALYENLMDDANPATPDEIHRKLASPETLAATLEVLAQQACGPLGDGDEIDRLAFAGVVVRHAEFDVAIPAEIRQRAIEFLKDEDIDWDEVTTRRLRRDKEIRLLESMS